MSGRTAPIRLVRQFVWCTMTALRRLAFERGLAHSCYAAIRWHQRGHRAAMRDLANMMADETGRHDEEGGANRPGVAGKPAFAPAMLVHLFTAFGAVLALLALVAAHHGHWRAMFIWLGLALIVDGVDGALARRLDVGRAAPRWSGEVLDLVIDFLTYVFVPAFAIATAPLAGPVWGLVLGALIVLCGAFYFADRRMKTADHHFRGFPALWNCAAFYLFVFEPGAAIAIMCVVALAILSFVPIRVIHPLRVIRLRRFNLALTAIWAWLAAWALVSDLSLPGPAAIAFCAIGAYFLFGAEIGAAWRSHRDV